MNKDTVVASIIGFGIGLVAAVALWVVPRILPKTQPTSPKSPETVAEKTAEKNNSSFTLSSPGDAEITKDKTVKIEGTASADSVIVISSATGSNTLTPKDNGSFSTTLELTEGANQMVVTSIAGNKEESKNIFIYYYPDTI